MKQMTLIEMNGFLEGKCIPGDLKVNETNAEYLFRKFGELESKLETALRECRSAGITIDNLEAKCVALAAENAALNAAAKETLAHWAAAEPGEMEQMMDKCMPSLRDAYCETPATDAFLAEVRAQGVEMFGQYHNFSKKLFIQKEAKKFAAQLRQGGAE